MDLSLSLLAAGLSGLVLATVWYAFRRSTTFLHILQQDGYDNLRFLRWLAHSRPRPFDALSLGILAVALLSSHTFWRIGAQWNPFLGTTLAVVGLLLTAARPHFKSPVKKPLKYTSRAVRILTLAVILSLVVMVATALASLRASVEPTDSVHYPTAIVLAASFIVVLTAPILVVGANVLLVPVQQTINRTYIAKARRKLGALHPVVVGITGSYGKTSTKYFAEGVLSGRYRVLKTPGSFNTTLGVCRVVNDELGPEHEVFVVEMGAYRRGDIRELAEMTRPRIGILTAIGPQHLERFGSIENVESAKYELIQSLPSDGTAIFNNDDLRCRALADRTSRVAVRRYGLDQQDAPLDVWAEDVQHGSEGLSFCIAVRSGDRVSVTTRLLGRHNVSNILAAATVGIELSVDLRQIARAIRTLQPVPHRLELSAGPGGLAIIDDSYNSNPVGAMNALEVLGEFANRRRIIITPGMVELGPEQEEWNGAFGARAAAIVNDAILVGHRQTAAIRRGLESKGFDRDRIHTVSSLQEGRAILDRIGYSDAVVLFENDLPDLYHEH